MKHRKELTPEEHRWRESTLNPEKLRRNLRRGKILLLFITPIFLAILIYACVDGFRQWWILLACLALNIAVLAVGVYENRRALTRAEQGSETDN